MLSNNGLKNDNKYNPKIIYTNVIITLVLLSCRFSIELDLNKENEKDLFLPSITPSPTQTPLNTPIPSFTQTPTMSMGSTMISSSDGMIMVYVPEGEFIMGSEDGESDEKPIHTVYLDGFWIDQTEVTNAQYRRCVKERGCTAPRGAKSSFRQNYFGGYEYVDYPVQDVTWSQAQEYCNWVFRRLPTEAEWEKASRGTDGWKYPWGNFAPNADLWNEGYWPSEVGNYPKGASPYGALDMMGNAKEWVSDLYDPNYYYSSPNKNPTGPDTGEFHVIRGWRTITSRYGSINSDNQGAGGFRCALSVDNN